MGTQSFIRRPKFAFVIIVIRLPGLPTFWVMRVDQFPDIQSPKIVVRHNYPGAPIESAVNRAEGMIYMSSNSSGDRTYLLIDTFENPFVVRLRAMLIPAIAFPSRSSGRSPRCTGLD